MTVCMYRDIHTLQLYIIDLTQRGCHTLRLFTCVAANLLVKIVMFVDVVDGCVNVSLELFCNQSDVCSSQQYLSSFPPAVTNVWHFEGTGAEHESSADEIRL